jgi:DNA-directed RNA polymerase subunit RPC12/RpoP
MMECKYCGNKFSTKTNLNNHTKTAKYCLKLRNIKSESIYKCSTCDKLFNKKFNLNRHEERCVSIESFYILKEKLLKIEKDRDMCLYKIKEYEIQLLSKDNHIKDLQDKLENIAIKAIEKPFTEEICIIDPVNIEEYKLSSLDIGEGYNIEHRNKDGYINVTNLCKAGEKKFADWKRIEKTKSFLQVLSSSMGIHINELIRYKIGSINERATWVHPHVAINIAQWISPIFDVKVSSWVYEAMMTGKVDISNTKTYKEIHRENKTLKNKYVKRRPRVEYKEKYVIYILTTRLMQKERRYIMGKATNLTSRLSTYNKSDEHRVVYHQGCGDEETMSLVENLVFHHLQKYREQANRERFILPKNEEITLFSSAIQKSVEYCKKPYS